MNCIKCGQPLNDNAKFCRHCGASQEQPVQQAQPKTVCPNCGEPYEGDGMFCIKCGARRNGAPQPAQQYYAPQQGYAQAVTMNAAASGGSSFIAWVPLILTVLAIAIAIYNLIPVFRYYSSDIMYILRNEIILDISALVVPVFCMIVGLVKKRSTGLCVVGAVFAGISLLMQLVSIGGIILRGTPYFFPGSYQVFRLINGMGLGTQLNFIMEYGLGSINLIVFLGELLFVVKNIVAIVGMLVLGARAKK